MIQYYTHDSKAMVWYPVCSKISSHNCKTVQLMSHAINLAILCWEWQITKINSPPISGHIMVLNFIIHPIKLHLFNATLQHTLAKLQPGLCTVKSRQIQYMVASCWSLACIGYVSKHTTFWAEGDQHTQNRVNSTSYNHISTCSDLHTVDPIYWPRSTITQSRG